MLYKNTHGIKHTSTSVAQPDAQSIILSRLGFDCRAGNGWHPHHFICIELRSFAKAAISQS